MADAFWCLVVGGHRWKHGPCHAPTPAPPFRHLVVLLLPRQHRLLLQLLLRAGVVAVSSSSVSIPHLCPSETVDFSASSRPRMCRRRAVLCHYRWCPYARLQMSSVSISMAVYKAYLFGRRIPMVGYGKLKHNPNALTNYLHATLTVPSSVAWFSSRDLRYTGKCGLLLASLVTRLSLTVTHSLGHVLYRSDFRSTSGLSGCTFFSSSYSWLLAKVLFFSACLHYFVTEMLLKGAPMTWLAQWLPLQARTPSVHRGGSQEH